MPTGSGKGVSSYYKEVFHIERSSCGKLPVFSPLEKSLFPQDERTGRRYCPGSRPFTEYPMGISSVPSLQRRNKQKGNGPERPFPFLAAFAVFIPHPAGQRSPARRCGP